MKTVLPGLALLLTACTASRQVGKNVQATWGLDVIRAISEDKQNILLPILQCERDGFVEDVPEYRTWAAKRKAPNGRIIATVPRPANRISTETCLSLSKAHLLTRQSRNPTGYPL